MSLTDSLSLSISLSLTHTHTHIHTHMHARTHKHTYPRARARGYVYVFVTDSLCLSLLLCLSVCLSLSDLVRAQIYTISLAKLQQMMFSAGAHGSVYIHTSSLSPLTLVSGLYDFLLYPANRIYLLCMPLLPQRLVGLVVRRPPRERKIPGSNLAGAGIFSGSSHTSDLKIGTSVVTLPGAWRYRVSAGTGRSGVSIL